MISNSMKAEATSITAQHRREVHKKTERVKRAERRVINHAKRASMIEHNLCEACGSRLKQLRRYDLPVCEVQCHNLWKGHWNKTCRKWDPKKGKKEKKVQIEETVKEESVKADSWDDIANRYLGKSRNSRVSKGTLCDLLTID